MAGNDRRAQLNLWLADRQYDFLLRFRSNPVTDFLIVTQEWVIEKPARWLLCRLFGHKPIADQCGDPAHDYCVWCSRSTPGAALRDGGAE